MTAKNEVVDVADCVIKVNIIESERGWGAKIDEVREFSTLSSAMEFIVEFNSVNTEEVAPAWYMYAELA